MRCFQVAQAYTTKFHLQKNSLVERQNRTPVSTLRVYFSRYMTDWDRYLPHVTGAYNSTQHSTTGMMPTRHEKACKKCSGTFCKNSMSYLDSIRSKLKRVKEKSSTRKQLPQKLTQNYLLVFQNVVSPRGTKKLRKKWNWPFMITEFHQVGRFTSSTLAELHILRTSNPIAHPQRTGVYLKTWRKVIIS